MSTAYFFTVDRMTATDIAVTFSPNHVAKHSKPGKKSDSFHYRVYHIEKLCVVDCLKNIWGVAAPKYRLTLKLYL